MRVIAKKTLRTFWESQPAYAEAKKQLEAWYREAVQADWASPQEVKAHFRHASILRNHRVVFNIAGNKYRLVVRINYPYRIVYIRFVGTPEQYDKVDAETL